MTDTGHFHLIAVEDYDTAREWWTIRTTPYDRAEAEQQARQLLTVAPGRQAYGDDLPDGHAATGDDQPDPAWSALWLTNCTPPCQWEGPPPGLAWQLPPPGQPWWTADGITPRPPAQTRSVALTAVQTATWAELRHMGLSDTDLTMLGAADTDLAALPPHPSDRPQPPHPSDRPQPDPDC